MNGDRPHFLRVTSGAVERGRGGVPLGRRRIFKPIFNFSHRSPQHLDCSHDLSMFGAFLWENVIGNCYMKTDAYVDSTCWLRTSPYISHLIGVAGIVLEHGGDADEAIAALLHDAIENQ